MHHLQLCLSMNPNITGSKPLEFKHSLNSATPLKTNMTLANPHFQ